MNTSELVDKVYASLAKAQQEMGALIKDKNNPFYRSKYDDLAAVVAVIRAPFLNHGLWYLQTPEEVTIQSVTETYIPDEQTVPVSVQYNIANVKLRTRIYHIEGQWIETISDIPFTKIESQGLVAAVTYGRRCALKAMVGIAAEGDDDDGNSTNRGTRPFNQQCPSCGKPAIIKGKPEFGGGFICYKNKGGCDTKFSDTDERIVGPQSPQPKGGQDKGRAEILKPETPTSTPQKSPQSKSSGEKEQKENNEKARIAALPWRDGIFKSGKLSTDTTKAPHHVVIEVENQDRTLSFWSRPAVLKEHTDWSQLANLPCQIKVEFVERDGKKYNNLLDLSFASPTNDDTPLS